MPGEDVLRRGLAAWFRTGGTEQPSSNRSAVETHAGKRYVVLRSSRNVLAVYRVRNDDKLKRLRRLPPKIKD